MLVISEVNPVQIEKITWISFKAELSPSYFCAQRIPEQFKSGFKLNQIFPCN